VSRDKFTPYLLSLPAMLFLTGAFFLPVIEMVLRSLIVHQPDGSYSFTFDVFSKVVSDSYNYSLLLRTIKLALSTVAVCLIIAFPVALHIRDLPPKWRALLTFLLLSPLLTSVVVRTLGWVVLLGPTGLINQGLSQLGLPNIRLLYTELGVLIGLSHVLLGYMVMSLLISMQKIDDNILLAASNLGAKRGMIIWTIILPLSLPGIVAGSVLVFSMAASAYATPVLLGGTQTQVVASEIYNLAMQYMEWDEATVLALALFCVTATVVIVGSRLSESGKRKVVFE
jgi:putative spermidine/putrescine transport system permease protein